MKSSAAASRAVRSERRFFQLLGVIAAAAVVLRLGTAWELGAVNGGWNSVFHPSAATDLATYMRLGAEVAEGRFRGVFYYQPFYYAVFLPLIRLFAGASVWAVIAVQALLGGATAYLAGLCGRRFGGVSGGLLAAGLTAVSTPLLLYAPFHQNETLQAFLLTLLFFLTLRMWERASLGRAVLLGAVGAAAILNRGNIWLFAPLLAVAVVAGALRASPPVRRSRLALWLLAGSAALLLPQLPFAVRNTRLTGRLCGASTAADAVLALGNTEEAPPGGRNPGLPAGPMEYPESFHLAMARAERGISVPRQMLEWLLRSPGSFLELQFRKLLLFWDCREIPNNVSFYGEGEASRILRWCVVGRSAVLITLGLAGCFLGIAGLFRRRDAERMFLFAFLLLYWGAIAIFYNLSRFRAPILPLVAVASAILAAELREAARLPEAARRRRWLVVLLALAGAAWITAASCDFYRERCEAAMMRLVRPEGVELRRADGSRRLFDHGPFSFGGWEAVPLTAGSTAEKRFGALRGAGSGELELLVLAERPGISRWRTASGGLFVRELAPGENRISLPVTLAGGWCSATALEFPPGTALVLDRQRRYGRSRRDGKTLPGEWCFRLSVR